MPESNETQENVERPSRVTNVEAVPVNNLTLDPANARQHPERNMESVKGSLQRFGQQQPIIVDQDNVVVVGNARLEAARALGWETIDVVRTSLSGSERTAFAIADNRTAELAEWDDDTLGQLLDELQSEDHDLIEAAGFTDDEVAELLSAESGGSGEPEQDETPEPPADPVTQQGDVWVMGELGHRVMCGDAKSSDDLSKLMEGSVASLYQTDPPYLVDYTGADRPNQSGKDWSDQYHEVEIKDAESFFNRVFSAAANYLAPNAAWYCWHAHKRAALIERVWESLGVLNHQQIIWVKPVALHGFSFYPFQHEPCLMGWKKGNKPEHDGDNSHAITSVWECDWEGKSRIVGNEHPTQKPIELFARPIRKHTKKGDTVLETFGGSGSQIIAAHQLGRRCCAMEVEPSFCDVICRRYLNYTGESPVRESDGVKFTDLISE